MSLFGKKKSETIRELETLAKRSRSMPVDQLRFSMETTIMSLGATYDSWLNDNAPDDEVDTHILALYSMFNQLKSRRF